MADHPDRLSTRPPGRPVGPGLAACWLVLAVTVAAVTPGKRFGLKELEQDPNITPGDFANLFQDFAYDYYPYLQQPEVFLANRAGDCDDYAVLADHILSMRGFKTRLIRVELAGTNIRHVVCYVTEKKAYLDYNNRRVFFNLQRSRPSVREIASKIADSLEKNWTSATEYTFSYLQPRERAVWTIVKTDPPERDPDQNPAR